MPLNLIFDANSPTQSADGPLDSFDSTGNAQDQDLVRADINLAISLRPVVESYPNSGRPWDDDFIAGDTFQVAIGNADQTPSSGDWPLGVKAAEITSNSVANPTVITTNAPHNLLTGDEVIIAENTGSTPSINGVHTVTVTGANTFTIPVNVTVGGTGGIAYDATGLDDLDFDIAEEDLETPLSTISAKHGFGSVEVELLATGTYQATWQTNGEVPSMYSPASNDLIPSSTVGVLVDNAGDADTQAVQIIALRRQPVAFCEPSTAFASAGVVAAVVQAGDDSPVANKIYSITMTPGTYAGTYRIAITKVNSEAVTIGVVAWNISAADLATLFATSTGLDATNFIVTRENDIVTVEFADTQGGSDVPTLTVTNINLLAPKGVSGTMALNTTNLYREFLLTTAQTLDFILAIRRTRASGEEAEIFQHQVTLKRNIINVLTMVPVALPTYLTEAQSDARYAKIAVAGIRLLPDTGEIIVYSQDETAWSLSVDNDGNTIWTPIIP